MSNLTLQPDGVLNDEPIQGNVDPRQTHVQPREEGQLTHIDPFIQTDNRSTDYTLYQLSPWCQSVL